MIQRRDLLAGLLGTSVASRAAAQATSRTARMLVGFPPGGSIDLVARALVEHVKVPPAAATIVDSRPGAGGRLALEALKAAPPDGLTVGLTPGDQLTLFPVSTVISAMTRYETLLPLALSALSRSHLLLVRWCRWKS